MSAPSEKVMVWKRQLQTVISAMLDFKVLALILLNVLLIYGITWDTVLRPSLEQLKGRDQSLADQKKSLSAKEDMQKQYSALEQQLKNLNTELIPVPAGNSARVVSVTEAAELLEVAKGKLREAAILPPLPPPHDIRVDVKLEPTTNVQMDLLKPEATGSSADTSQTPSPAPAAAPTPGNQSGVKGGMHAAGMSEQVGSTTLPVERYDYDLKATGTYAALMDLLNELVIRKKLIKINKIVISRPANSEPQPDAKNEPDFPVKLNMVVSLSMFLYNSNEPVAKRP